MYSDKQKTKKARSAIFSRVQKKSTQRHEYRVSPCRVVQRPCYARGAPFFYEAPNHLRGSTLHPENDFEQSKSANSMNKTVAQVYKTNHFAKKKMKFRRFWVKEPPRQIKMYTSPKNGIPQYLNNNSIVACVFSQNEAYLNTCPTSSARAASCGRQTLRQRYAPFLFF